MLARSSKFSRKVLKLLEEVFPYFTITEEYYINYNGKRLFFDFFVKEIKLLVEVQGEQHLQFNRFMHETKEGFMRQKMLDRLKEEWADLNDYLLIHFYPNDSIDRFTLLEKIEDVQNKRF